MSTVPGSIPSTWTRRVLQAAADRFVGTHDFAAVRSVGHAGQNHRPDGAPFHRPAARGDLIECRVCANGFLYNMCRAMVGTIVYAAEGKFAPTDIPAILEKR